MPLFFFSGSPTAGTVTERSRRGAIGAGASVAPELFLVRYDTAATAYGEIIRRPANLGVRWALPGGLQRLEFTIRAKSRFEARQRYNDHLGDRIALFDGMMDTPICDGWVYEIIPDGVHVHYIAAGSWKRHEGKVKFTDPSSTTDNTNVFLGELLTGLFADFVQTATTYLEDTGTDVGNYTISTESTPPNGAKIVNDLIAMGNSNNEIVDYWLVPSAISGIYPNKPYAYFKGRDSTDTISWQCRERDLSALDISRNIWDLANTVWVAYTQTTTVSSGGTDGSTSIVVASATNFVIGDEIQILTDNNNFHSTSVGNISGSTFTLIDPLPHTAAAGNMVKRVEPVDTATASDADSGTNYWTDTAIYSKPELNQTQAEQYRDALLAQYKDPAQLASFTIGSGYIRNYAGSRLPVWRMLINPGIIRINDLFADGATFTNSIDGLQSFRIVAMDYDHNGRSMRVTPDTLNEARLDVLLQRAGIEGVGQIVDRS
jgi:hypothetical protein